MNSPSDLGSNAALYLLKSHVTHRFDVRRFDRSSNPIPMYLVRSPMTTEFTPEVTVPQVVFDVPAKRLIKGPELDRTRTSTEGLFTSIPHLGKYLRDLQELGPFLPLFWAALGKTEVDHSGGGMSEDAATSLPQRSRNPPSRPGMVDSESMQITLVSPSEAPSSQSSSSDSYHQDERFHPVPEDATIEVARAFIQHVLLHIPSQKTVSASGATLDAPPDPLIDMEFAGNRTIQATADGELEFWVWNATHHRYNLEPARRLALLEAKSHFAKIVEGVPLVTNTLLGQMTCEALSARTLGDWNDDDSVFVIHATRHYLRVFRFVIPGDFVDGLGQHNASGSEEFIRVSASKLFNLTRVEGRRGAVAILVSLVLMAQAGEQEEMERSDYK
ncbi:hypothetical protein V8E54_007697 [Elaphomyces granulatus]